SRKCSPSRKYSARWIDAGRNRPALDFPRKSPYFCNAKRLVASGLHRGRKVRATQSILLPNRKGSRFPRLSVRAGIQQVPQKTGSPVRSRFTAIWGHSENVG